MKEEIKKTLSPEEIKEVEELLETKVINTLPHFLKVARINYDNLHEIFGVTLTFITQLKNRPEVRGTLLIAQEITERTGVRSSVLINSLGFGKKNITLEEMDNLVYEETILSKEGAEKAA